MTLESQHQIVPAAPSSDRLGKLRCNRRSKRERGVQIPSVSLAILGAELCLRLGSHEQDNDARQSQLRVPSVAG